MTHDSTTTPAPAADPAAPPPPLTWDLVIDVFDAFERAGFHRGDDRHVSAATGYLLPLVELYSGERDELVAPGVAQHGGGWLSGPST
jgi:hypothetical protein